MLPQPAFLDRHLAAGSHGHVIHLARVHRILPGQVRASHWVLDDRELDALAGAPFLDLPCRPGFFFEQQFVGNQRKPYSAQTGQPFRADNTQRVDPDHEVRLAACKQPAAHRGHARRTPAQTRQHFECPQEERVLQAKTHVAVQDGLRCPKPRDM